MLNKVKAALLSANIPMIAFSLYVIKALVFSASYPDAIILAIISGLYGYGMKMNLLVPRNVPKDLEKDVQEIKNALSKVNLASVTTPPRRF